MGVPEGVKIYTDRFVSQGRKKDGHRNTSINKVRKKKERKISGTSQEPEQNERENRTI